MKVLLLVAAALAAVHGLPYGNDPEYAMVPEADGTWKLLNVHEEVEPENFFDVASDVHFILYTRENPSEGQFLLLNNEDSVRESNFNPNNPTRITIHGWNSNANAAVNILCRDGYLQLGQFNVITVDWGVGATTGNYATARNRVGSVGAVTSQFINLLRRVYPEVDPSDITIVGHSLGAHVAGFVGKNFINNDQLGVIVALDAALPLFSIDNPAQRVANTDARYVESIHTNTGQLGFDQPLGVSSFYPNFGNRQPGCGIDITGNCAHGRAVEFFAESITTTRGFWSRQCSAYKDILMEQCTAAGVDRKMGGEPVENLARGIYWTATNSNSPFATGVV